MSILLLSPNTRDGLSTVEHSSSSLSSSPENIIDANKDKNYPECLHNVEDPHKLTESWSSHAMEDSKETR